MFFFMTSGILYEYISLKFGRVFIHSWESSLLDCMLTKPVHLFLEDYDLMSPPAHMYLCGPESRCFVGLSVCSVCFLWKGFIGDYFIVWINHSLFTNFTFRCMIHLSWLIFTLVFLFSILVIPFTLNEHLLSSVCFGFTLLFFSCF